MRKVLSVILAVLLVITVMPLGGLNAFAYSTYYKCGDYKYALFGDKAIITSYTGSGGDIVIPSELDGYQVTGIGVYDEEEPFYGNTSITGVIIPEGVTGIAEWSFSGCYNLKYVYLPSTMDYLYDDVFEGVGSIQDVWYSGSEEDIDLIYDPYSYCSVVSATWHYNACIGEHIYSSECDTICDNCSWRRNSQNEHNYDDNMFCRACGTHIALEYVISEEEVTITRCNPDFSGDLIIPDFIEDYPVTNIAINAFSDCNKITSMYLPNYLKELRASFFKDCYNLRVLNYNIIDCAFTTATNTSSLFDNCPKLDLIIIGDDVVKLPEYTFKDCDSVSKVIIGVKLENIGFRAFLFCSKLKKIGFYSNEEEASKIINGGQNESFDTARKYYNVCRKNHTYLGDCDTTCEICYWPREAEAEHIYNEENICVTCGDTDKFLYTIENGNITIEEKNEELSGDFIIPQSIKGYTVKAIADSAFNNCKELTSVTIPESITSISSNAFKECDNFVAFIVHANNSFYASVDGVLYNKQITSLVKYPAGKNETDYIIPNTVTNICTAAFYKNIKLAYVEIPNGVVNINGYTFYGCSSLEDIVLPKSVVKIGNCAFDGCSAITNIWYTGSTNDLYYMSLGYYNDYYFVNAKVHFNTCSAEHSYSNDCDYTCNNCDWTREKINEHIYSSNSQVICESCGEVNPVLSYNVYDSYVEITDLSESFSGEIIIPSIIEGLPVTKIANSAFLNCALLTKVTIPDSVISIGNSAFYCCESLEEVLLPKNLQAITERMFSDCVALKKINIPSGITSIENYAFRYCETLEEIILPRSIVRVCDWAFDGCTSLKEVWYRGDEFQKDNIVFSTGNTNLLNATWNYNSCSIGGEHTYDNACDTDCNVCGGTREVPDHVYIENTDPIYQVAPATCTLGVKYAKSCSMCGEAHKTETFYFGEVDNSNHADHTTRVENSKEPSCFELGYTGDTYCNGCDALISNGKDIEMVDHNPDNKWSSDSENHWKNCLEMGCGNLFEIQEHIYDNSCDITCDTCGWTRAENEITHDWEADWSVMDGHHFKKCKNCDARTEEGEHLGGIEICGQKKVCAICNAAYGETIMCNSDNEIVEEQYLVSHANCQSPAVYRKSCSRCSTAQVETFTFGDVNSSVHLHPVFADNYKAPTCTEEGYTGDHICFDCKEVLIYGEAIPTVPHIAGSAWESDGTYHWHTCSNDGCGAIIEDYIAAHIYDNPCDTDCNVCGATREVPGHIYSGAIDADCENCGYVRNVTSLEQLSCIKKTKYYIGETLDLSGGKIEVTYDNGDKYTLDITPDMITAFDNSSAGVKQVVVTVLDCDLIFNVEVLEPVKLSVDNAEAMVGGLVSVDIKVLDNSGFSALTFATLYNKDYFTLVSAENKATGMNFVQGKNFVFDSLNNYTANGTILTLTFSVSENTPEGDYDLDLLLGSACNNLFEMVSFQCIGGTISVYDFKYGDVNGDNAINAIDLAMMRGYLAELDLLTGESSVEVSKGADANGDGVINAIDLAMLRTYLANLDLLTGESSFELGPQK